MKRMLMCVGLVALILIVAMTVAPVLLLAAEEKGSILGLNWETGLVVLMMLITALAATAWAKLKVALKEIQDVFQAVIDMLADDKIDNEELARVAKEGKEAGFACKDFLAEFLLLFKKKSATS